jgi:hypothetical protein
MSFELSIPGGKDERFSNRAYDPFRITGPAAIYEWAMVLAERHPYSTMLSIGDGQGVDGKDEASASSREAALRISQRSQKIFEAIKAAYQAGKIAPLLPPRKWYEDPPPVDLTRLVFRAEAIAGVVRKLGATGDNVSKLLAAYPPRPPLRSACGDATTSEQIIIPSDGTDFFGRTILGFGYRDRLTVYELCMVCTNHNPHATSGIFRTQDYNERTLDGWETRLTHLGAVEQWRGKRYGATDGTTHNPADDEAGPEFCEDVDITTHVLADAVPPLAWRPQLPIYPQTDDPAWTRNELYRVLVDAIKTGNLDAKTVHLHDQPDLRDDTLCEIRVRPAIELLSSKGYSSPMFETLLAIEDAAASARQSGAHLTAQTVNDKTESAKPKPPPRKRGRKPDQFERTKAAMIADMQDPTRPKPKDMIEKEWATTYGASRDTCRKAFKAATSEMSAIPKVDK